MSTNLPAIRYELFVKAFEAQVVAHQRMIAALRGMERPYNLVKNALEAARLPLEQKLTLGHSVISISMTAAPDTLLSMFDPLIKEIGDRLFGAELHKDGEPSIEMGGFWHQVEYRWRFRDWTRSVVLTVLVPEDGLPDLEVEKVRRICETTEYQLTRVEPPSYPAPENFKNSTPTPTELTRIEAELGAAEREELPF